VSVLRKSGDANLRVVAEALSAWNYSCEPESVAPAIFNVFCAHWCRVVAEERFAPEAVELMSKGVESCAMRLLVNDEHGWFRDASAVGFQPAEAPRVRSVQSGTLETCPTTREDRIVAAMRAALGALAMRLGPDSSDWTWGRLHRMPLRHVLSARGDLGRLLDRGGIGVRGDMATVCNTGCAPDFTAPSGAGYRLIADLSISPPKLLAIDGQSQSGHPGSPHYSDQLETWLTGGYHEIPLDRDEAVKLTETEYVLAPK
jgi:acyl-homoserine lactone acylase PvdQ